MKITQAAFEDAIDLFREGDGAQLDKLVRHALMLNAREQMFAGEVHPAMTHLERIMVWACIGAECELVEAVLRMGFPANYTSKSTFLQGGNLLGVVAGAMSTTRAPARVRLVRLLIERGAHPNPRLQSGASLSSRVRTVEIATILISAGTPREEFSNLAKVSAEWLLHADDATLAWVMEKADVTSNQGQRDLRLALASLTNVRERAETTPAERERLNAALARGATYLRKS